MFASVVNFTVNLGLYELERKCSVFLHDCEVCLAVDPRLTFKLSCSLSVTEQRAIALAYNWTVTLLGLYSYSNGMKHRSPAIDTVLGISYANVNASVCRCHVSFYCNLFYNLKNM